MFDILVYLFENFYQNESWPEQDALAQKLHRGRVRERRHQRRP